MSQLPHQVEVMSVAEFLEFKSLNPKNPNTTKQQQQAQHFLSSTTRGSTNAQENIHMNSTRGGGGGDVWHTFGLAI